MKRQDAIRKIQALRAKASPKSGATKSERETARALATTLQDRYEITEAELTAPTNATLPPRAPDVDVVVRVNGRKINLADMKPADLLETLPPGWAGVLRDLAKLGGVEL